MHISRRSFFASAAAGWTAPAAPLTPLKLGVIGSGARGRLVMASFQKDAGVGVAAICDVYEPNLERGLAVARRVPGHEPVARRHYHEVLDDRSIDAVLIGTPEHWHHRMVLDALAAGKDIYVEKPLCRTPEEGVELVAAERRSSNIVQVGMQRRTYDLYLEARRLVQTGALGRVLMARAWWLNSYLDGQQPDTRLDGRIDWEQWQGPVGKRVPVSGHIFRHWRNLSDYAGGIAADLGTHIFDAIHLLMDMRYPSAVTAAAGRPHKVGFDTPESIVVTAEYPQDLLATFSLNYGAMRYLTRNDQAIHLDGDRARMDIGREQCRVYSSGAEETVAQELKSQRGGFASATDLHVQDFLECVRTRRAPRAPMSVGFPAALVVQMANMSLLRRRRVTWDPDRQSVA